MTRTLRTITMHWLRKWLDLSLRAKCLLLISCPAAATVAMAAASYLAEGEIQSATQRLEAGLRIANAIERLRTGEIETSADVRGYAITGDEPFASQARAALADVNSAWQRLYDLTAGDPLQRKRLTQVSAQEMVRVENIFGSTARLRSGDLARDQVAGVIRTTERERVEMERILRRMEDSNAASMDASLIRVQALRGREDVISGACLFFGLVGGVVMTLLFAHGILRRVNKLQKNILRINAGASLDPLTGRDEIGALSEGVAAIARLNAQQRDILRRAPVGVAELDGQGRYRWVNGFFAKIVCAGDQQPAPTLSATLPFGDRPRVEEALESMQRDGTEESGARLVRPFRPDTDVELNILRIPGPHKDTGFYVFLRELGLTRESETALIQAKDHAIAANEAKTDFLAKISHDIRTPLNAILGAADLLSQTALSFDQSEYVHMFQRNCRRLVALINDFLDFSRIEAGAVRIEKAPFRTREIAGDAVATFREDAARKGVALRLQVDSRVPEWQVGDALRIQQVLINLLSNALKFTSQGSIELRITPVDGPSVERQRLRYEVLDTGPGIAAENQDRVFMKFVQLPHQTAGQRGAGLGLPICRDLVELMGGEIGISSEVGMGSNFYFVLPLETPPVIAGAISESSRSGARPDHSATPETAPSTDIIRILVAEDTEDNRVLLEYYLRSERVNVRFAFNGQEAVDIVQRGETFDIILMDIDMPVLDGFAASRAIRSWEQARGLSTPILAVSADAMSHAVRQSLEAGCVAHVAKPVDRTTLISAVQQYAKRRQASSLLVPAPMTYPPRPSVSEQVLALVPQYLASKERQIEEARRSLTTRDFGPIRRFGHNLKGTGSGYGFPAIEELGRQIERAAAEADVDRIAKQLDALHQLVTDAAVNADPAPVAIRS